MFDRDPLRNLWSAGTRFLVHRIYPSIEPKGFDSRLFDDQVANASSWMTPDTLSGVRIEDFPELDEDEKRELAGWIRRFREIVDSVVPSQSASRDQIEQALVALLNILGLLRPYLPLRDESLQINQALSDVNYPESVRFLEFEVGSDSTGDPAVWIWVVMDDEAASRKSFAQESSKITRQIREAISRAGIERWPYIRYRTLSEHLELSGQAAR